MSRVPLGYEVRRWQHYYAVYRGEDRVSGAFSNKFNADEAMERIIRRDRKMPRTCLCCGAEFLSEGPHNRLCSTCRTLDPEGLW